MELTNGDELKGRLVQYVGGYFRLEAAPRRLQDVQDSYIKRIVLLRKSEDAPSQEPLGPEDPGPYRVEPKQEEPREPQEPPEAPPQPPTSPREEAPEPRPSSQKAREELEQLVESRDWSQLRVPENMREFVIISGQWFMKGHKTEDPNEPLATLERAYNNGRMPQHVFIVLKCFIYRRSGEYGMADRMAELFKQKFPENEDGYRGILHAMRLMKLKTPRGKMRDRPRRFGFRESRP